MTNRSWCTWHGSNGTCVSHRACQVCPADQPPQPPVLQTPGGGAFCIKHAVWNMAARRWETRQ